MKEDTAFIAKNTVKKYSRYDQLTKTPKPQLNEKHF